MKGIKEDMDNLERIKNKIGLEFLHETCLKVASEVSVLDSRRKRIFGAISHSLGEGQGGKHGKQI